MKNGANKISGNLKYIDKSMQTDTIASSEIQKIFKSYDWKISLEQAESFNLYLSLLLNVNLKFNLTGYENVHDIINQLFIDSLEGTRNYSLFSSLKILDIGSGAGIPLLPIKIVFPHFHITLVESNKKKCSFLKLIIDTLKLDRVNIVWDRSENIAHKQQYREQYDIVVARAVAPLRVLIELSLPFLKLNGDLLAYKGIQAPEEINNAHNALEKIGGKVNNILWYTLKQPRKKHATVIVKKLIKTPDEYPRKPGIPQKRPL